MNRSAKRILPILLGIVIIASTLWYLFVYDMNFTRDMLLAQARHFDNTGNHSLASWFYDQAYRQSGNDETVAIELAEQFRSAGNYTKAEVTLSKAIADGGSAQLYIELCKVYVEQDKLLDAVTMLDHIADATVRAQLNALRPAAPTATPDPGYYGEYITATVTGGSGTLYLTTNGEYPSTGDEPSDGTVSLAAGENTVYALVVGENGLVSPLSIFGYTISGVIEEVSFTDSRIEEAVRKTLNVDSTATILSSDLWTITALELPEGADSYEDLGMLTYLEKLTVIGGTASGCQPLSTLTHLSELTIRDCYVSNSDLSVIASLPALTKLTLSGCGLSGIDALSTADGLTYLDLSDNSIRDLSALSFTATLTSLDLSGNALTSLNAISSLAGLQSLDVSYNSLTSVGPAAGCTQLKELNISNNMITSVAGLDALTALENLDASHNDLTDISPLGLCTGLKTLDLSSNQLTDISSLYPLTGLEHLYFSRNQVSVLPNWGKKNALVTIDGSYNQISIIAGLAGFEKLNYVLMDYNEINSVDALTSCPNLIKVSVYGNPVTDVSALTSQSVIVNYNPLGE